MNTFSLRTLHLVFYNILSGWYKGEGTCRLVESKFMTLDGGRCYPLRAVI